MRLLNSRIDYNKSLGYVEIQFMDGSVKEYTLLMQDVNNLQKDRIKQHFKEIIRKYYLSVRILKTAYKKTS